jgi:uncharacterized coiled-coil protein SlyX
MIWQAIPRQRPAAVLALLGLAGAAAACGPSAEVQRRLAELESVSAEKDSLLVQVAENVRIMSEISAELARVQPGQVGTERPARLAREEILENVRALGARLDSTEERLARSEQRIAQLTSSNAGLQRQLNEAQRTVRELYTTIENQKVTIASLTDQVEALEQRNVVLAAENTMLFERTTELSESLSARENTVYYVIGTKDELIQRGIIDEEGGSRVLFVFGRRGRTMVPSRDMDTSLFTAVDKRLTTEIVLPEPDRRYRIVSRQDVTALDPQPDSEGRITGVVRIVDPERFWANNPYLILVRS